MAEKVIVCDACKIELKISKPSDAPITFCLDCNLYFCKPCADHHSKFPLFANHSIIPSESIFEFPFDLMFRAMTCNVHSDKLKEYYCPFHCEAFCFPCLIESHRLCDFRKLKDVTGNVRLSHVFTDLRNRIGSKYDSIKNLLRTKTANIQGLLIEKIKFEIKLKSFISEVNQWVSDITHQHELLFHFVTENLTRELNELHMHETEFLKYKEDLDHISTKCSEDKIFLSIFEIENALRNQDLVIKHIDSNCVDIRISDEVAFESLLHQLKEVKINLFQTTLNIDIPQLTPAQLILQPELHGIHDAPGLNLRMDISFQEIDSQDGLIRNFTTFQNGQIIAVDEKHDCFVEFNKEGILKRNVKMQSKYFGITKITQDIFAVTDSENDSVEIYDKHTMNLIKHVYTVEKCSGIAKYSDNSIVVGCNSTGIRIIDSTGNNIAYNCPNELMQLNQTLLLTVDDECRIFCSLTKDNSVIALDSTGKLMFTFSSEKLKGPYGITVDRGNNILVAGSDSNNIVWIRRDGKKCKELLTTRDGIWCPYGIEYNKQLNILVICNCRGSKISIYEYL